MLLLKVGIHLPDCSEDVAMHCSGNLPTWNMRGEEFPLGFTNYCDEYWKLWFRLSIAAQNCSLGQTSSA